MDGIFTSSTAFLTFKYIVSSLLRPLFWINNWGINNSPKSIDVLVKADSSWRNPLCPVTEIISFCLLLLCENFFHVSTKEVKGKRELPFILRIATQTWFQVSVLMINSSEFACECAFACVCVFQFWVHSMTCSNGLFFQRVCKRNYQHAEITYKKGFCSDQELWIRHFCLEWIIL